MSRNRRREENPIEVASVVKWILMVLFLGLLGLGWVYLKNKQHTFGDRQKALEKKIASTALDIQVAEAQIAEVSSRSHLQRRLAEGFISLIPIPDDRIVRLVPLEEALDRQNLRPVSNDTEAQP